jgi:uncharacterized protein (TIGR02271 family)
MLDRKEFVKTHPDVRTGMTAYSTTGERIGVIEQIGDDNIMIEKGRIFHKDVSVPYDDIEDVREDEVIIRERGEEWGEREERFEEPREYAGPEAEVKIPESSREQEQAAIPLREEELEAQKREKEGEVRVRKEVRTETQRLEVPVQKEEVYVEHVPASEARAGTIEEGAFEEQEVRIPVREEEVEVTKRPVVKEEVRVGKDVRTEEQEVSGEVRKENVTVERTKPTEKKK